MAMIATIDKKQNRQQGFYSLLPILLLFSCSNGFNKVKNKPKIFLVIFPWKALQPSRRLFQFPREVLLLPRRQQAQGS